MKVTFLYPLILLLCLSCKDMKCDLQTIFLKEEYNDTISKMYLDSSNHQNPNAQLNKGKIVDLFDYNIIAIENSKDTTKNYDFYLYTKLKVGDILRKAKGSDTIFVSRSDSSFFYIKQYNCVD